MKAYSRDLELRWLPGRYAFCRLDARQTLPAWALAALRAGGFVSITRTEDELSIIMPEAEVPHDAEAIDVEAGFAALHVLGPLDFGLVGILATLTSTLAEARVPVCAVSTFDTDILLVKAEHLEEAKAALASVAKFA